jgi:hypothetical protein
MRARQGLTHAFRVCDPPEGVVTLRLPHALSGADRKNRWAALLKRVFGVDVLKCSRCQGKMRLIACIEEPDVAKSG